MIGQTAIDKTAAYKFMFAAVVRAHFEDDELLAMADLNLLPRSVYDYAKRRVPKQQGLKISLCLKSRWQLEDFSDLFTYGISQVVTWAVPMKMFGEAGDDNLLGNIVDSLRTGFGDLAEWTKANSLLKFPDVDFYDGTTSEKVDSIDPEEVDNYFIDFTFERQPARFLKFLDPDAGKNGIKFINA